MPDAGTPAERLVVTGPTGWIGRAMVARYAALAGEGWRERIALFGSSRREETGPDGAPIEVQALDALTPAVLDGAMVVHLAYLTKEKADEVGERAFTERNIAIDDRLLGALAHATPRSLFVASSGAAKLASAGVDRHPYGMCKLRQEDRFLGWARETQIPTVVGRIFNVAGPYINKLNSYAIGAFVQQALTAGRIDIAARVPVFRSFLHVADLCELVLKAGAQAAERPTPIDLCGCEVLEMGDIAATIACRLGDGGVPINRADVDWRRPSAYLGDFTDTGVLAMQLGAKLAAFPAQIDDTIVWIKQLGAFSTTESDASAKIQRVVLTGTYS